MTAMWKDWKQNNTFSEIVGVPAITSSKDNHLNFFFRGKDAFLHHAEYSVNSAGVWTKIKSETIRTDKTIKGPPAAAAGGANAIDVFVRGTDDKLYHISSNGSSWSAWDTLDTRGTQAILIGPPAATSSKDRTDVFVIGQGNHISHTFWKKGGGGWTEWVDLTDKPGGVAAVGAPTAASGGANFLDVFALSLDGADVHIHHISSSDGKTWSNWDNLSNRGDERKFMGAPSAVSWKGKNRTDVLAHDAKDHKMYHTFWQAGSPGWSAWSPVGTSLLMGQPASANDTNDQSYPIAVMPLGTDSIHTFAWMTDKSLKHNLYQ